MSHNLHEISANYIESMISNVKDMKAIIFDNETQVIFSLEFSKSLALKQEIFLFESIDKIQTEQKLNLNGIFFIRPTLENLEQLKRILQSSNFKEINLFFTNQITDDYLQKLAQYDINMQVKNVQEIYLDYYIINSNVFHLNIESCICNLDMNPIEKWNQYDVRMNERIYQGLISACLSNRMKPIIKSVRGSDICVNLGKKLAKFFDDNYDNFIRKECGSNFNGILLLYDRKEDPISPLINQWTYQAQLHEILGIKNNVIELKKGNDIKDKPEKYVISDVESIDKFYSKYKFADYGTVANAVQQEADKLKSDNDMLNKESSIEELRKIIDQLPEKKKESMAITKHYKLFYSISEYVTKHKLMDLSKIEQDISVNDNKKDQFNQIVQIISDPKVQHLDKCKLYLLYMLRYENDSSVSNLKHIMIENKLGDWVSYGDALLKYAGKERRKLDCFQDKDILSKGKKFFMNAFGQGNENAFMQHISYLNGIVERLLKGRSRENETININCNSMNEPKVNNLIVFVFGGITFEETRDLTLLGNQLGVNIVCGGTNIINSKSFLAEMSMIKEKMNSTGNNDTALLVK
jgi:vacuolar protein sorting-associated protein 45